MDNGNSNEPIIVCRDVNKWFGNFHVLKDINLEVQPQEVVVIIGPSGSGKSTFIRCINRLEEHQEGQIIVDGIELSHDVRNIAAIRSEIGMVFQQFNLFPHLTVQQNITLAPRYVRRQPRRDADQIALQLLDRVGIPEQARKFPGQLSGGQRQRVAIARALASDPQVLLCDEATSALDPMTTQSILALLKDINERLGITVVLITHEMAVIRQICTRVAILDGGRIAEEGTVDDVFVHTRSAAGKRLFGILPENDADEQLKVPALRIVFDGGRENRPIIAELVRKCGVDVNILSANIRRIGGKPYGQMLIGMPEDAEVRDKIMKFLLGEGLTVKEVWPQ